ncbi:hypothetical protein LPJ66_006694, partial [Kickxella alabastrina]
RIILNADRRHRTDERSRSTSRPRRPIANHLLGGTGQLPTPSQLLQHPSVSHSLASHGGTYSQANNASHASQASYISAGGRAVPPPMAGLMRPQHRNSAFDVMPSRVQSLQSTPQSLRPVSVAPGAMPVMSDSGHGHGHGKRLSMGMFRRAASGSNTSLFRQGSYMSEDSSAIVSPPLQPINAAASFGDGAQQHPQSIAAAMMNRKHSSSMATNSAVSAVSSGSSNSVRKMFSGSFLRALRSRESVNDPNI